MTGDEAREVCEARLPQEAMERLGTECGVVQRQRKRHLGMLGRAMGISAGTPGGAYQAEVLRSYLEWEVPQVARSAGSRWCDEPRERCMAALAAWALADARAQAVERSGPRGGVTDGDLVAATTVTVRDALRQEVPGPGDDAAMNVHQVLSVGGGAPVQDHFRPAREHDSRPRTVDASWRGYGLRADVASARLARLRAGDVHGVRGVIRRHEHWQPQVDDVARGQVAQACCPGTDLDARLEQETRCLDGRVMDAEVPVSRGPHARPRRLVGVHTPPGDGCFLTHRPPRIGPRQVADRSRVRWAVARSIRLDTAVNRLDALDPAPPCSWKTRVPASLIASTIAALRAPTHHGHTRPQQVGAPRTEAPLHPRRLAWPLAIAWQSRAQAFELQGAEALRRWDKSAAWLTHSGRDPNGRRRPAV